MKLKVNEIFRSIQGESTFTGLPCVFVRLSGCNLRCVYCDTTYAYDKGTVTEISAICETVENYEIDLVCITGGEPLLQNGTPTLAKILKAKGHTVLIETNGSVRIDCLPDNVISIMDIKCPDSGMSGKTDWSNIALLKPDDEVKFVLSSRNDYEWAKEVVYKHDLIKKAKLLFGAAIEKLTPGNLAEWILNDKLNVRLQIQLHKYIHKK
ncbi:MAG: radical SAM protein [Candidatus Anammoxibacter sp.]